MPLSAPVQAAHASTAADLAEIADALEAVAVEGEPQKAKKSSCNSSSTTLGSLLGPHRLQTFLRWTGRRWQMVDRRRIDEINDPAIRGLTPDAP